eukprot:403336238
MILGVDTDKLDNLIDISPDLATQTPNNGDSQANQSQRNQQQRIERWTHVLQYTELCGDRLRFYSQKPDRLQRNHISTNYQFVIYRKNGLVEKLKFECIDRNQYLTWIDCLKKTQRPQWADPEVNSCYICETEFSLINRQHHCRKCGTAVCKTCSNYFIRLPEFAYYRRVRTCRNCMENIQQKEKILAMRRQAEQRQQLINGGATSSTYNQQYIQGQDGQPYFEGMMSKSDRPQDRLNTQQIINNNPGGEQQQENSLTLIDQLEIRYLRDNQGYNSFNNHISNNPDESNSYLHLSQFPA